MLVKNSQQDIIYDLPKHFKKIGLKLSGGADSAMMGYLLCKYIKEERPDLIIVPVVVEKLINKYHFKFSKLVLDFYKEQFPDIIFEDFQKTEQHEREDHNKVQHILLISLMEQKIIDCCFTGLTADPPDYVIFKHNGIIFEHPDRTRCKGQFLKSTITAKGTSYKPLVNIDKIGIFELYQQFNLLDSLFILTYSCESMSSALTNNFERHCWSCWDCSERKWAFKNPNNIFDLKGES